MLNTHIPTFLGIVFVLISIITAVLYIEHSEQAKQVSALSYRPQNVRVTNITDTSFTVTWLTTNNVQHTLLYGEKISSLQKEVSENEPQTTHSITLSNLEPEKQYYFAIESGSIVFDNNSIPWTTKTGPSLPNNTKNKTLSGTVYNVLGNPLENALVYALIGGGTPISAKTSAEGSFVFSLSKVRAQDLNSYLQTNTGEIPIEILVYTTLHDGYSKRLTVDLTKQIPSLIIEHGGYSEVEYHDQEVPDAELILPRETLPGFGELLEGVEL